MAADPWQQGNFIWRVIVGKWPTRTTLIKAPNSPAARKVLPSEAKAVYNYMKDLGGGGINPNVDNLMNDRSQVCEQWAHAELWALISKGGPGRLGPSNGDDRVRRITNNNSQGFYAHIVWQQLGASKDSRMIIEAVGCAIMDAVRKACGNRFNKITSITTVNGGDRIVRFDDNELSSVYRIRVKLITPQQLKYVRIKVYWKQRRPQALPANNLPLDIIVYGHFLNLLNRFQSTYTLNQQHRVNYFWRNIT